MIPYATPYYDLSADQLIEGERRLYKILVALRKHMPHYFYKYLTYKFYLSEYTQVMEELTLRAESISHEDLAKAIEENHAMKIT